MPAGKGQQSNGWLYAAITFIGLFLVALVVAIIFYLKFEDQRTIANDAQRDLNEMVTKSEWRNRGKIIGAKQRRKSYLGTMVDYLDEMAYLIIGGLPEETSAEVKVDTANRKVKDILEPLAQGHLNTATDDPNTAGLVPIMEKLKTKLDNTTSTALATQEQLKDLQNRFDDAMAVSFEKEQTLLAEKEKYEQQVNDIKQDYNKLEALMRQTSEQQVKTLTGQLDEEKAARRGLRQELLKTQATLKMTEDRMKRAQGELQKIKPLPDIETPAFKPDGKIILIDDQTKIVHLNIGSDDGVYRGLTFSVYDKDMPIPKDGKGKAEIEVFSAGKTFSAARIIRSQRSRPIVSDDIVANLIWDSDKTNVFVVAGEFDLDSDGDIDYDGVDKIKALIEKWGGRVADTVSIETDFLVLGSAPQIRRKPTFEIMEVYPMAMEKYEATLKKLTHYKEVQSQAQVLSVPVFNAERFLYFIGYKAQSDRPGAF